MSEQRAVPEIPEDLRQDYALTVESLPTADDNSRRVLGQIKYYIERIATLTAERDALAATLRQGAESDTDLRKKYEALKLERDTERSLRESSEQENDRLRTERDRFKQKLADSDLAFAHANEVVGKLEADVARLSAPVSDAREFLIDAFLDAMNDIGRLGHDKYRENSFQHRRAHGDTSRGGLDRTKPQAIADHAREHFNQYLSHIPHDHFGTDKHQLAAVAFNAMMEYYFACHARTAPEKTHP